MVQNKLPGIDQRPQHVVEGGLVILAADVGRRCLLFRLVRQAGKRCQEQLVDKLPNLVIGKLLLAKLFQSVVLTQQRPSSRTART